MVRPSQSDKNSQATHCPLKLRGHLSIVLSLYQLKPLSTSFCPHKSVLWYVDDAPFPASYLPPDPRTVQLSSQPGQGFVLPWRWLPRSLWQRSKNLCPIAKNLQVNHDVVFHLSLWGAGVFSRERGWIVQWATAATSLGSWTQSTGSSWLSVAPGLKDSMNPVLNISSQKRIKLSLLPAKISSFSFIVWEDQKLLKCRRLPHVPSSFWEGCGWREGTYCFVG